MKKILTILFIFFTIFSCNSKTNTYEIENLIKNIEKREKKELIIYVSSWCPHCNNLIEKINKEDKIKENIKLIFIPYIPNNNKLEKYFKETKEYIKENKLENIALLDEDLKIKNIFSIKSLPTVIHIDNKEIKRIDFSDDEEIIEFLKNYESGEK